MPSVLIGNPLASGAQQIVSGNPWSGDYRPIGGVQLVLDRSASGAIYVGTSGNITLNSGGMFLTGGGLNDGVQLAPGGSYFIPKLAFVSGEYNLFIRHDAACSGQARLFYERGF